MVFEKDRVLTKNPKMLAFVVYEKLTKTSYLLAMKAIFWIDYTYMLFTYVFTN
jgi:hypothetical protein